MIDIEKLNRIFVICGYEPIESAENYSLEELIAKAIKQDQEKYPKFKALNDNFYLQFELLHQTLFGTKTDSKNIHESKSDDDFAKTLYAATEEDANKAFIKINKEDSSICNLSAIAKAKVLCKVIGDSKKVAEIDAIEEKIKKNIEREDQRIKKARDEEQKKRLQIIEDQINAKLAGKNEVTFIGNISVLSDRYEAQIGIKEDSNVLEDFLNDTFGFDGGEKYKITIKIEPIPKK